MNDREVTNAALATIKHLSHLYHGLSEHTANEALLREATSLMTEKQNMRLRVFQAMNQRGWYNPQLISPTQVQQHRQQMHQAFHELQHSLTHSQSALTGWQQPFQSQAGLPSATQHVSTAQGSQFGSWQSGSI